MTITSLPADNRSTRSIPRSLIGLPLSCLIGRRGSSENGWTWLLVPRGPRPPRPPLQLPWRFLLAAVFLAALIGFSLLGLWLARSGSSGPADALSTPTPVEPATPVVAPPQAGPRFRLAVWSDVEKRWRFENLTAAASAYHEGEAIPFMLRIEAAGPGSSYALTIRYDCAHGLAHAFDFLTGYDRDRGSEPAQAPDGPRKPHPETLAVIPDDATTPYDDKETGRAFALWGGSILGMAGPFPQTPCDPGSGQRVYVLGLAAAQETVFLLWSGHLASAADWGEKAASSSPTPLRMRAEANDFTTPPIAVDPVGIQPPKVP